MDANPVRCILKRKPEKVVKGIDFYSRFGTLNEKRTQNNCYPFNVLLYSRAVRSANLPKIFPRHIRTFGQSLAFVGIATEMIWNERSEKL